LQVDSERDNWAVYFTGKYTLYAMQDISNGQAFRARRNLDEAGTYPLGEFWDDHTSNTKLLWMFGRTVQAILSIYLMTRRKSLQY